MILCFPHDIISLNIFSIEDYSLDLKTLQRIRNNKGYEPTIETVVAICIALHAIATVHDKLDALGDGAEFADDELVTQKFVMMRYMRLEFFPLLPGRCK